VIIEDSEDPNARRTYGLRDVLKNSSVKIATGAGYGRGAMSVLSNYTSSIMRGVYGPYLNALYGETDDSNNTITSQSNSGSIPSISNNTVTVNPTSDVEKNKMMIWKFFRAKGYSKEATAGIIGNMMKEDGTLTGSNKSRSWNNSSSFTDGIIQWDPFTKHINWAKQNGYDPYDLTGQLMHVVHMIENEWATWRKEYVGVNGYRYIPGPEFKYCTDIANATVAFERGVEGSGDWSSDRDASRIKYAMSVYQTYANSGMGRAKSLIKSVSNKIHTKYGKASTHNDKSITNKYVPKFGRADEPMTTTPTTDTGSKSILYQVGDYAGKLLKGVYGKYFDALYATEQADNSSSSNSSGSTIPADFNPNGEIYSPINGPFYISSMYSPTGAVGTRGKHGGIDLVAVTDTKASAVNTKAEIYSLSDGIVVHAGWQNNYNFKEGFGLYVAVKDKNGDVWYYGHLSSVNVTKGSTIRIGTIVGVIGTTGESSGVHLHFEVRKQNSYTNTMDPATIIGIPSNLDYISAGGILNALFVGNVFNPRTHGGGGHKRDSDTGSGRGRSAGKRTSPSQAIQSRISNMQKSKTIKRNAVNNSSKIFTDREINTAVHDFQKDSNNNKLFSEYKNIDMRSTSGHGTNNSKDNGTTIVNNNTNVELDKVVNLLEALVESNKKNDIIINLLAAIVTNTESGATNQKFKSALSQIQSSAPSDILSQVYSLAGM
jgi:murein DD-endopeptidase MepM/ murein hydrolase activator NlpD